MINTLKDVREIGGKRVLSERPMSASGEVDWDAFDILRESSPIFIDHDVDMISFKMLTKPASEGGNLDLCQLTTLIEAANIQLKYLNDKFPCRENAMTITKLEEALMWQEARTKDRLARSVEGKNLK
jgi:hypothetical protein